jgi:hypothetical protein
VAFLIRLSMLCDSRFCRAVNESLNLNIASFI